jgi:hypothetical protein
MFIGFYWSNREETRNACGRLLFDVLSEMSEVSSVFKTWYAKGRTKKASFEAIDTSAESLALCLKSSRNDYDSSEISELGFSASLWNGNDQFPVSIGATIGGYSEYVRNSLVIQLPTRETVTQYLSDSELRTLFTKLVTRIQPDNGAISSYTYLDKHDEAMPWEAGWLVYSSVNATTVETGSIEIL